MITPEALDVVRDHRPTARRFGEMLDEEGARWFVHEDIPVSIGIVDDDVGINLTDEQGVLKGGLVSENETVHEWAVDLFETYRERSRPVDRSEVTA